MPDTENELVRVKKVAEGELDVDEQPLELKTELLLCVSLGLSDEALLGESYMVAEALILLSALRVRLGVTLAVGVRKVAEALAEEKLLREIPDVDAVRDRVAVDDELGVEVTL